MDNNKKKVYKKPKVEIHGNLKNITKMSNPPKGDGNPDATQPIYTPSF
jgi:hypothetical protein